MEDGLVQTIKAMINFNNFVLILVVVEDGLVQHDSFYNHVFNIRVLILVVVEDGLVLDLIRLF